MPKQASKDNQPIFTRVAVEGATVDGRTIERVWLTQAAANYDPEVKGARVWVEHMRSMWSDSPFSAQGDVVALKAEEIKTGKLAGKMALYAAIKPLPELVQLNKRGKKIYSSIEVEPKFADTGEAYLTGLAVTDEPASMGVEVLKFSAKQNDKKFSSEPLETTLEFSVEEDDEDEDEEVRRESTGLLTKLIAKFNRLAGRQTDGEKFNAQTAEVLEVVGDSIEELQSQVDGLSKQNTAFKKANKALREELDTLSKDFNKFKAQVDGTDADPVQRKPATGANADAADC